MSDQVLPPTTPVGTTPVADDRNLASAAQAIAAPIANVVAAAPPVPPQPQVPSFKESKPYLSSETAPIETATGESAIEKEPIPEEVEAWMEKVGQAESLPNLPKVELPPTPPQAPPAAPAQSVYVLPLGELEVKQAMHASVNDSIKWLATWCVRMIKKLGPQAAYRQVK